MPSLATGIGITVADGYPDPAHTIELFYQYVTGSELSLQTVYTIDLVDRADFDSGVCVFRISLQSKQPITQAAYTIRAFVTEDNFWTKKINVV
jgi:hypothetical protein